MIKVQQVPVVTVCGEVADSALFCPHDLIGGAFKSPLHSQRAGKRFSGLQIPWQVQNFPFNYSR